MASNEGSTMQPTIHIQPLSCFVYHGRRSGAKGREVGVSLQIDPPDDFTTPIALVTWSLN